MNNAINRIIPIISLIFLLGIQTINAQQHRKMSREDRERIEARKVAYITDRLDLSPEEAQKFWPVYNKHEEAIEAERKAMRENPPPRESDLTDDEATAFIEKMENHEQKMLDLKINFHKELKEVISPKKIVLLIQTEKRFREELIRHLSGARGREGRR
jgi:hypothetical protein